MLTVKEDKRSICISCCDKTKSAKEVSINRDGSSYKGTNIVSFALCNDCLNKLARERKYSVLCRRRTERRLHKIRRRHQ